MLCLEKFKESLEKFSVDENSISQINVGYEDIGDKTSKKQKQHILNVQLTL